MSSTFVQNEVDVFLKFNTKFDTVFDLSYLLIDLQSLISGFEYSVEDSYLESYSNKSVAEELPTFAITDEIVKRIDNIISIDEYKRDQIKNEVFDVIEPKKISKAPEIRGYRTSSRSFLQKRKQSLKLNSFEHGSLILEVTTNVLGSIIVEFLKKILFKETGHSNILNVNYYDQKIIILNNGEIVNLNERKSKTIKIEENNIQKKLQTKEYLEEITNRVTISPDNIEDSVKSLLEVLQNEGLISKYVTYDQRANKTIVKNIERIKGSLLDIRG